MKNLLIALTFAGMIGATSAAGAPNYKQSDKENYRPPEGYVPNAKVAEQIAYAVLIPVYGQKLIDSERPFKVTLIRRGTTWNVEGTLPNFAPQGGTFVIEISKRDGRILRMMHYQ